MAKLVRVNRVKSRARKHWSLKLLSLGGERRQRACLAARIWARLFPTYAEAWKVCARPDWLRWLIVICGTRREVNKVERIVNYGCFCSLCRSPCVRTDLCDQIREVVKRPLLK